jgi:hypothetical protein
LYRELEINGLDGLHICREPVQESPSVAGTREELLKRLERLKTASRQLVTVVHTFFDIHDTLCVGVEHSVRYLLVSNMQE